MTDPRSVDGMIELFDQMVRSDESTVRVVCRECAREFFAIPSLEKPDTAGLCFDCLLDQFTSERENEPHGNPRT